MRIKSNISNKLLQKIIMAYQGEVYGEALFAELGKLSKNPTERTKWQLLMRLEQAIQFELRDWLISIGKPVSPNARLLQEGEHEAQTIHQKAWPEAMRWLKNLSQPYVKEYMQMSQHKTYLTDIRLQKVLQRLADHERALFLFASLELSGNSSDAQQYVKSLLTT